MVKQKIDSYEQAMDYVCTLPRFSSTNTMEDTKDFLRRLGNPEKNMKIIHVAGTNGKGSVCAYLCSLLKTAGYSYSQFTSPHLADIRERFVINGRMIAESEFLQSFLYIYDMLPWNELENEKGYHPTFFEFLFFIAMILFQKANTDYCVLETGLGGRLDATNSISCKEISVITHMGLDHTECLGDTIVKIAGEKAGIMHAGAKVVYWETDEDVTYILSEYADRLIIPAFSVSKRDYTFINFSNKTIDFSYRSLYYDSVRLRLHTIARYQMENASLALRTLEVLLGKEKLTPEVMQTGIASAFWAGRMEEILPNVYVDGAHNGDGIRAFLETVSQDGCLLPRKLLFGVVQNKAYEAMIQAIVLSGLFTDISVVQLKSARALNEESLEKAFRQYWGKDMISYHSVKEAFDAETGTRLHNKRLYIAGSLYLVGEIKELL
ncbi:MAG TPA: bifunctional folylpolyglutamate synthase/dihydrofolate synthase [Lachnospiraceae bacterium]|nr:bifunctional folylpolyglutamate synthase/dihydrofolate synthase [Lachnospiraceae bacterium]